MESIIERNIPLVIVTKATKISKNKSHLKTYENFIEKTAKHH